MSEPAKPKYVAYDAILEARESALDKLYPETETAKAVNPGGDPSPTTTLEVPPQTRRDDIEDLIAGLDEPLRSFATELKDDGAHWQHHADVAVEADKSDATYCQNRANQARALYANLLNLARERARLAEIVDALAASTSPGADGDMERWALAKRARSQERGEG